MLAEARANQWSAWRQTRAGAGGAGAESHFAGPLLVLPGHAFVDIASGVQGTNIGMTLKEFAISGAACAARWRIVFEVLVNQAMRARHDQRSAGAARHIAEQRVRPDAGGRTKRAQIVRVGMPAARRHIPRMA